jgi:hypothetical protein
VVDPSLTSFEGLREKTLIACWIGDLLDLPWLVAE